MRIAPPLSNGTSASPAPVNDLDALLHSYFRAEMPNPWPAPPSNHQLRLIAEPIVPAHSNLHQSRLALAASVAILIGGTLCLPTTTTPIEPQRSILKPGSAEATRVRFAEQPKATKPMDPEMADDGTPRP